MRRSDGTPAKEDNSMYYLIPHFLKHRYDSQNMITLDIPEQPLKDYKNKLRKEGKKVSHLSLIVSAYVQTLIHYPKLNRFIVNSRIYDHNDITASMVVLRPGNDEDTISKIYFDPKDNLFDIDRKITEYIDENRKDDNANNYDKIVNKLVQMSGLMRFAISALHIMDRHNLLPNTLIKASPFHASFLISNLASIRTNHIYHHVYEFGTTSVAITVGNMREVPKNGKGGEIYLERSIPLGVVMDERICSGHYFATAFHYMQDILTHPEKMEKCVEEQLREEKN